MGGAKVLPPVLPPSYRPIHEIAREIMDLWPPAANNPPYWHHARPYVLAMRYLSSVSELYGCDSGYEIVSRFLSNAQYWRGTEPRRIKAELNKILKEPK